MTIDEAIHKLLILKFTQVLQAKIIAKDGNSMEHDFEIAVKMATEALEKQEPKKPIGDLHSVPHYRCPACNGAVKLYEVSNTFMYCHWCGQALDWRDE